MKRENISARQARAILLKDDAERHKWSKAIYNLDISDPKFYDMILHLDTMKVNEAVSIILHAIERTCFQTTRESRQKLDDLALSAQVEAALIKEFPKVAADARNHEVFVHIRGSLIDEKRITRKVRELAGAVPGVKNVRVNMVPCYIEE
jgi:hypothetical protein